MKVCDLDGGADDVMLAAVVDQPTGRPTIRGEDGTTVEPPSASVLVTFDACGPCRQAIKNGGLDALAERLVSRKRAADRKAKRDAAS